MQARVPFPTGLTRKGSKQAGEVASGQLAVPAGVRMHHGLVGLREGLWARAGLGKQGQAQSECSLPPRGPTGWTERSSEGERAELAQS